MSKDSPSKADVKAIQRMPTGWFDAMEIYNVRCPRFRCERLETRGLLESRYVGTWPNVTKLFRKTAAGKELNPSE